MHPFTTQDIASRRTVELRRRAEHQMLARLAQSQGPVRLRPGQLRRALGWRLVDAGLRLALSAEVRRESAQGARPLSEPGARRPASTAPAARA